jgi:ribosomal protein S18 acetylase RimI-like enzyme
MRAVGPVGVQVSVRRFTPADAAFVSQLSERAFGEYGGRPAHYTASVVQRPNTVTWLAVEADAPVGLVVLELDGARAAILALAVTERARGRGIGGRLMQVAERHAREQHAGELTLWTADANLAALDLFLGRGFRIVRRKAGFYSRRQNACQLEKAL